MRHEVGPVVHLGPHFGGRGGRRWSAIVRFKRAIVVSYRLSIVIFAPSLIIRPQFAIECLYIRNYDTSNVRVSLGVYRKLRCVAR